MELFSWGTSLKPSVQQCMIITFLMNNKKDKMKKTVTSEPGVYNTLDLYKLLQYRVDFCYINIPLKNLNDTIVGTIYSSLWINDTIIIIDFYILILKWSKKALPSCKVLKFDNFWAMENMWRDIKKVHRFFHGK